MVMHIYILIHTHMTQHIRNKTYSDSHMHNAHAHQCSLCTPHTLILAHIRNSLPIHIKDEINELRYYYEPNPPLYINCIRPAKMLTVHIFLHSIYFNPYGLSCWRKLGNLHEKSEIQLQNCSFYVLWCPLNFYSASKLQFLCLMMSP